MFAEGYYIGEVTKELVPTQANNTGSSRGTGNGAGSSTDTPTKKGSKRPAVGSTASAPRPSKRQALTKAKRDEQAKIARQLTEVAESKARDDTLAKAAILSLPLRGMIYLGYVNAHRSTIFDFRTITFKHTHSRLGVPRLYRESASSSSKYYQYKSNARRAAEAIVKEEASASAVAPTATPATTPVVPIPADPSIAPSSGIVPFALGSVDNPFGETIVTQTGSRRITFRSI
ncbi:hypothetical protein QBC39DRAFT_396897 [Podospora conica]|nr:hypothetical protein QBC39DRAFT_396897 [Schizothecium conicum]